MDAGFEAVGYIVDKGDAVKYQLGQPVALTSYGAFAEYVTVPARSVMPVASAEASTIPLLVSGLTASLALERVGEVKKGETVLVTAAAGGTGIFAVQLAKLAGAHVIGTCSSDEKVKMLKSLGCDRVINYKTESVNQVLRKEYKRGVDVVYESVGGAQFQIAVKNLAEKGRLIVIGQISGYLDQSAWSSTAKTSLSELKNATDRDTPNS